MSELIIERHTPPVGFRFISEDEYNKFVSWKDSQRRIKVWKLQDLAWHRYRTKSTLKASQYLIKHRNDLDIDQGGFIDYEHTHNGWNIPAAEMMDYLENHPD